MNAPIPARVVWVGLQLVSPLKGNVRLRGGALLAPIAGRPECPIITADGVAEAKPSPDLFELAASKLEKQPSECFVVGDSVWDVLAGRRIKASVIALRTGGFDGHELQESGAYRVYADMLGLSESLEQLGFSTE